MDTINKALLFDGQVKVVAFKTTDLVNKAISLHNLSPLAAVALGKVLTVGAYMSNELKGEGEKLSISIKGNGTLGGIIVAADYGAKVRGYVENPSVKLAPLGNGKQNLALGVGGTGFITVIKDLKLKEPYVGKTELVRGNIDEDFAWYFTRSEGCPTALALDVVMADDGKTALSAGGVIVQPMPGCPDHILVMLEDIVSNFADIGVQYLTKSADDILKDYFGHFDIQYFDPTFPTYQCKCSREMMLSAVKTLGKKDGESLLSERGKIEVTCQFCGKKFTFGKEDITGLWEVK